MLSRSTTKTTTRPGAAFLFVADVRSRGGGAAAGASGVWTVERGKRDAARRPVDRDHEVLRLEAGDGLARLVQHADVDTNELDASPERRLRLERGHRRQRTREDTHWLDTPRKQAHRFYRIQRINRHFPGGIARRSRNQGIMTGSRPGFGRSVDPCFSISAGSTVRASTSSGRSSRRRSTRRTRNTASPRPSSWRWTSRRRGASAFRVTGRATTRLELRVQPLPRGRSRCRSTPVRAALRAAGARTAPTRPSAKSPKTI